MGLPGRSVGLGVVLLVLLAGCMGGPAGDSADPGTITVTVSNTDDSPHPASVTLLENETVVGQMSADSVRPDSSVRFAAQSAGTVTVRVESGPTSQSFQWNPDDCSDLAVNVTIEADGNFRTNQECQAT